MFTFCQDLVAVRNNQFLRERFSGVCLVRNARDVEFFHRNRIDDDGHTPGHRLVIPIPGCDRDDRLANESGADRHFSVAAHLHAVVIGIVDDIAAKRFRADRVSSVTVRKHFGDTCCLNRDRIGRFFDLKLSDSRAVVTVLSYTCDRYCRRHIRRIFCSISVVVISNCIVFTFCQGLAAVHDSQVLHVRFSGVCFVNDTCDGERWKITKVVIT